MPGVSDFFGAGNRALLDERLAALPRETRWVTERLLAQVEALDREVRQVDRRVRAVFQPTPETSLLRTLPVVGLTLAVLIAPEVGDVKRFATGEELAAYAGSTPRVHSSGGRTRHGLVRSYVNRYLKWAFVEAANVICRHRQRYNHLKRAAIVYVRQSRLEQVRHHAESTRIEVGGSSRH